MTKKNQNKIQNKKSLIKNSFIKIQLPIKKILTLAIPALFIQIYLQLPIGIENFNQIFGDLQGKSLLLLLSKISNILLVLCGIFFIQFFFKNLQSFLTQKSDLSDKPIKAIFQVLTIFAYTLVAVYILSVIIDKSLGSIFGSIGAITAVLILVFRDSLLGLVASFQISFNRIARVGDWIEIPSLNIDGVVKDISLTVVTVENWDKTLTHIPSYQFVSSSLKNWQNMEKVGGRRIKRNLLIDIHSIHFYSLNEIKKLMKIEVIKNYLEKKMKSLKKDIKQSPIEKLNNMNLTNIGVFRIYIENYLKKQQEIRNDLTFLVRQLQPSEKGLPIEIYVFTQKIQWVEYEKVQSDIFDHLIAASHIFNIVLYKRH